jgi:HSF-type DNA-binding
MIETILATKAEDDHHDDEFDENSKIFPQKLMEILSEPSNADAITWLPHGHSFIIKDRQKFSNQVLPKYFRKTKYTSFTRKLNRWNFLRVNRGSEIGAYSHEFQQGREALCIQMYCKNDRAKFAVSTKVNSKKKINEASATEPRKPSSPLLTQPSGEQPRRVPAAELVQRPGLFPKVLSPTINPALQARAALFGQQPAMPKDQLTQSFIRNSMRAFQSPMGLMPPQNQDVAAMFRMQQLAAIQRHLQGPPPQRQPTPFTNYRASAA